jgi:hypothetical protein
MNGSRNAQVRQSEGWVEGTPSYASSEPHHVGTSMCYREMYNEATESALTRAIETDDECEIEGLWIRAYVPDYESEYNDPAAEYYLVRTLNGVHDEVRIPTAKIIDFDFTDEQEVDGRIVRDCYDATIGNF